VLISHSVAIANYVVIEPNAIVYPGVSIGSHTKICANVVVTRDVPDWSVVYGNGSLRRSRKPPRVPPVARQQSEDGREAAGTEGIEDSLLWKRVEEAEMIRVKGLDREREATTVILRNAARAAVAAKRQSVQR
jgi:tetrahydrodipicolinate N-succinyltransferase